MEQLLPIRKLFGRRDAAEQTHTALAGGLDQLRQAGKMMITEAKRKSEEPELAAQIAFEAGGCWRTVADFESERARAAAAEEAQKMRQRGKQKLIAPSTRPAATQAVAMQPVVGAGQESEKEARACYQTILQIAPDSPTAAEAKAALAELDQARPLGAARRKAINAVAPTRIELPVILNLDGTAEFPQLAPFVRSASSDLADEGAGMLDEGLLNRRFELTEEVVAVPGRQN